MVGAIRPWRGVRARRALADIPPVHPTFRGIVVRLRGSSHLGGAGGCLNPAVLTLSTTPQILASGAVLLLVVPSKLTGLDWSSPRLVVAVPGHGRREGIVELIAVLSVDGPSYESSAEADEQRQHVWRIRVKGLSSSLDR
jgi:hypothetical protein